MRTRSSASREYLRWLAMLIGSTRHSAAAPTLAEIEDDPRAGCEAPSRDEHYESAAHRLTSSAAAALPLVYVLFERDPPPTAEEPDDLKSAWRALFNARLHHPTFSASSSRPAHMSRGWPATVANSRVRRALSPGGRPRSRRTFCRCSRLRAGSDQVSQQDAYSTIYVKLERHSPPSHDGTHG